MHVMTPQLIEKHLVSVRDRVVELERELRGASAPSDSALLVADEELRALRTELDYLEVLAG
jgi:hypothetical protein